VSSLPRRRYGFQPSAEVVIEQRGGQGAEGVGDYPDDQAHQKRSHVSGVVAEAQPDQQRGHGDDQADIDEEDEDVAVMALGQMAAAAQSGQPALIVDRGGLGDGEPAQRQVDAGHDQRHEAGGDAEPGDDRDGGHDRQHPQSLPGDGAQPRVAPFPHLTHRMHVQCRDQGTNQGKVGQRQPEGDSEVEVALLERARPRNDENDRLPANPRLPPVLFANAEPFQLGRLFDGYQLDLTMLRPAFLAA
jgi:hypothetical protein